MTAEAAEIERRARCRVWDALLTVIKTGVYPKGGYAAVMDDLLAAASKLQQAEFPPRKDLPSKEDLKESHNQGAATDESA